VFTNNGLCTLKDLCSIDETSLDELGITLPEDRTKILTAVRLLQDCDLIGLYLQPSDWFVSLLFWLVCFSSFWLVCVSFMLIGLCILHSDWLVYPLFWLVCVSLILIGLYIIHSDSFSDLVALKIYILRSCLLLNFYTGYYDLPVFLHLFHTLYLLQNSSVPSLIFISTLNFPW